MNWSLLRTIPHETESYTQGFEIHKRFIFETTGLYGKSKIKKLDKESGVLLQSRFLGNDDTGQLPDNRIFGEGCALVRTTQEIYVLTWKNEIGFVYDMDTLQLKRTFRYKGQGWGFCYIPPDRLQLQKSLSDSTSLVNRNTKSLINRNNSLSMTERRRAASKDCINNGFFIMSNGSDKLIFLSEKTMEIIRTVRVHYPNGKAQALLNDLAMYKDNTILANIYGLPILIKIDIQSGIILQTYDFKSLLQRETRFRHNRAQGSNPSTQYAKDNDDIHFVMNGIAWDRQNDCVFVTGKQWREVYVIDLQ
eukprot:g387.t1